MKRIGLLTGGGDCPGLNAVIRAAPRRAVLGHGWDVIGFEDGFQGVYERRFRALGPGEVRGLLTRGGTILGTSNRANPFSYPVKLPGGGEEVRDVSAEVLAVLRGAGIEALVAIGGDGTMMMSERLGRLGLPMVGVPKTIDNDLAATDLTFGHSTAVAIATEALDRLQTTAESHDRVMVCEVMGRYAGWIALHAGIAGGADVILIPELPYQTERVAAKVLERRRLGITHTLVCVSEGARPVGGGLVVQSAGDATQLERLGGAGERLARELTPLVGRDIRVTVLGHIQRGGSPDAYDRILATRFGVAAIEAVARGETGCLVALAGTAIRTVPLAEAVGRQKLVPLDHDLLAVARGTGCELGAPGGRP